MWPDRDPYAHPETRGARTLRLALTAGLHVLLVAVALTATVRPQLAQLAREMEVRLVELRQPEPPAAKREPPRPLPQAARPIVRREPTPPPVLAAAPEAPSPAVAFTVPPSPPAPAAEPSPPPAAPAAATPARFDADYLHNPKPAYPVMSRRLGEQGRVLLNVRVLADGTPEKVEVKSGSGYPRLDQAALEAVSRWRFVPAKRGEEPVDAWVLVPLNFSLDR